ncbi:MAG TPA: LysR family transcriptional regulator [Rhizomicrobium sp.]
MEHLDWDDFRVFAAVVRAGSFTRAARELELTEPTVSRRIKRLEESLGARLFDRGKGMPRLTAEGRRVLGYSSAAEHSLSRAAAATESATRRVDGDCNLIVGDGLGSYWMPAFLPGFFKRYPSVNLRLFTSQEFGKEQTPPFDIQIWYSQPLSLQSVAVRVATLHFILHASPAYIENFGTPRKLDDLRDHRLADSVSDVAARGALTAWANLNKNSIFMTNSNILLGEAMRAGTAIALVPTFTSAIFSGLVPVLPEVHFAAPVYLCFERDSATKPAVRATIEYLKTRVFVPQKMPWFADEFITPQKSWRKMLSTWLDRPVHQARARPRATAE